MSEDVEKLLNSTIAGKLAMALDAKDGNPGDNKINESIWNAFVTNIDMGKTVTHAISLEYAMNSITTYCLKLGAAEDKTGTVKVQEWLDNIDELTNPNSKTLSKWNLALNSIEPDKDPELVDPSKPYEYSSRIMNRVGKTEKPNWLQRIFGLTEIQRDDAGKIISKTRTSFIGGNSTQIIYDETGKPCRQIERNKAGIIERIYEISQNGKVLQTTISIDKWKNDNQVNTVVYGYDSENNAIGTAKNKFGETVKFLLDNNQNPLKILVYGNNNKVKNSYTILSNGMMCEDTSAISEVESENINNTKLVFDYSKDGNVNKVTEINPKDRSFKVTSYDVDPDNTVYSVLEDRIDIEKHTKLFKIGDIVANTYNENQQWIKGTYYYYNSGGVEYWERYNDTMCKTVHYKAGNIKDFVEIYNDILRQNLNTRIAYKNDGKSIDYVEKFDEKGNPSEKLIYNKEGTAIMKVVKYEYGEQGKKEAEYISGGTKLSELKEYHGNGELKQQTVYNDNGGVYCYNTWDEKGRAIRVDGPSNNPPIYTINAYDGDNTTPSKTTKYYRDGKKYEESKK